MHMGQLHARRGRECERGLGCRGGAGRGRPVQLKRGRQDDQRFGDQCNSGTPTIGTASATGVIQALLP